MANTSRLITDKNENKHISRLINAVKVAGRAEAYLAPEGTWGSVAKITFRGSPVISAKAGETTVKDFTVILNSDELDFEFEVPFDDNLEANEGEIIVYNLSNETCRTLNNISKSSEHTVSIVAGYKGDTGLIFKGRMSKITTKREGSDRVTTIKLTESITNAMVNTTFSGVTAKHILGKLIDALSLPIATFSLVRDHTYENDVTVDESVVSAIKTYSEVCGVSTFISRGNLYCCKLNNVDDASVFDVSEETGMIGSPTPFVEKRQSEDYEDTIEGVNVEMLLQHRLSTGAEIHLKSEQYDRKYYVKSGTHIFNESECKTTFTAICNESYKTIKKAGE